MQDRNTQNKYLLRKEIKREIKENQLVDLTNKYDKVGVLKY